MICGRCDQPIRDGEPYTAYDIEAASGPGATVYLYVAKCKRVPVQTTQVTPRH
ncbi:hypothetical protein ACH4VM_02985 [Streptomyces sp. NPDC020792]|uniref:hypothetical protein n=1 Tax=Streptomyces sp. NPDC020792 TaxID=3365089 RepID=UPI00379233BE